MWESTTKHHPEFVYLLAWPDEATKNAAWANFMADEEWKDIKRITSAEHGDLIGSIEDRTLTPASYSPPLPQSIQVPEPSQNTAS